MDHRVSRRTFLRTAAVAGAAVGVPYFVARPGWSQTGPIKIGVCEPQSGPVKFIGDANIAGYRYAVEKINAAGGVLGRKLEVAIGDSELKPEVATRRANDLVLGEKADFLVVNTGSNVAKAVSQVADTNKKVFFSTGTEARELTGDEFFPTTFRCCLNTDMHSSLLAVYLAKLAPQKPTKVYLLNEDYNFGRAAAEGFVKKFNAIKGANQQIVGDEFHPLQKVQDFGPYITKIMASGAEVVMTGDYGQDLRLFLQQGTALGWKVKVANYFLNDPTAVQPLGKAAVGHISADAYLSTLDTPANLAFIKDWHSHHADAPLNYSYPELTVGRCFNAVLWLADVVKRAGSLETDKVIKAWEGAKFRTPWGVDVEMRACDHQMQTPGYIAEITEPEKIPQEIRYFGSQFPSLGKPIATISEHDLAIPPKDTGNKRC